MSLSTRGYETAEPGAADDWEEGTYCGRESGWTCRRTSGRAVRAGTPPADMVRHTASHTQERPRHVARVLISMARNGGRLPLRTNAVSSWGLDMSGALVADFAGPAVVEEAVDRVDWAVCGRDPGATLSGRAGEDWVGGGMSEIDSSSCSRCRRQEEQGLAVAMFEMEEDGVVRRCKGCSGEQIDESETTRVGCTGCSQRRESSEPDLLAECAARADLGGHRRTSWVCVSEWQSAGDAGLVRASPTDLRVRAWHRVAGASCPVALRPSLLTTTITSYLTLSAETYRFPCLLSALTLDCSRPVCAR